MKFVFALVGLVLACLVDISVSKDAALETVSKHGQLSVQGVDIVDESGEKVQLKGMSLFWDVWMPQYYNKESIDGIHDSCHSNVVRAAVSVVTEEDGGYIETPEASLERLYAVVDAAIEDDIYVIIDWHDHEADQHLDSSLEFFDIVSKKYSGVPNIIYETFNEPTGQSWNDVLKPYHEAVINVIRANDPDNIIVVGTPTWSQSVDQAAANPITGQKNIMYTLHFYAGTHKQWLRDTATNALNNGIPIFVTEYGTVNADATDPVDEAESRLWWDWLDEHNISYANWAISDKLEGASALVANATSAEVCLEDFLTESGRLVVAQNKA
uniref:Cellulase n=1 Tax=Psacothea hilaris TaxID=157325 RepID=Q8T890_PSAHI|nr:cellulase [Psacothea hilaris]